MIVAPGIVDVHTHYDPQLTFDPYATMSCFHGVTTVVAGNCGFSVAPCKPEDREFLCGIFARVENMDPDALSAITWDQFVTFAEYLESRPGRLGVNMACYVGHSNLRRWVMGEAGVASGPPRRPRWSRWPGCWPRPWPPAPPACPRRPRRPTPISTAVPSPPASATRPSCWPWSRWPGRFGGTIAYLPKSSIGGLDKADEDYLIRLGQASGLPVIIQGLGGRNKVDAPTATWEASKEFLERATAPARRCTRC